MKEKKKAINPRLPEPYCDLGAEELDADTAKFDREFVADRSRPLTRRLRGQLRKASRRGGRPRIGRGAKKVLVTIERDLLKRSDALARRKKTSRSRLIAMGLETLLAAPG